MPNVLGYISTHTDLQVGDVFLQPVNAVYDTKAKVGKAIAKVETRFVALYNEPCPKSIIWKVVLGREKNEVVECCVYERL